MAARLASWRYCVHWSDDTATWENSGNFVDSDTAVVNEVWLSKATDEQVELAFMPYTKKQLLIMCNENGWKHGGAKKRSCSLKD